MAIKTYNPTSPARRQSNTLTNDSLTADKPFKALVRNVKRKTGRNNRGVITCRHKGGGHKQLYRIIDFKRTQVDIPAVVETIEYDPNRNCNISLVCYANGRRAYILHPEGLKVGDKIQNGPVADKTVGNSMSLKLIPLGTAVHNIELRPGSGGKICRSAGTSAQIVARESGYVTLRLPSSEMRKVSENCLATIGVLDNSAYKNLSLGKAGRSRWLGRRPQVRGSVMNPVDHPHGGGEGRSPVGRSAPRTPWGKKALGVKTRSRKKSSNRLIVRRRSS